MADFKVDASQLDDLAAKLKQMKPLIQPILRQTSDAALLSLIPDMARYPAPPPNSRYTRTGTLGRTWTAAHPLFQVTENSFLGSIGNNTEYAPYVQKAGEEEPHQAWMHKGRWQTDDDVLKQHEADLNARWDEATEKIASLVEGM